MFKDLNPTRALIFSAVCYNETEAHALRQALAQRGLSLKVIVRPHWYP